MTPDDADATPPAMLKQLPRLTPDSHRMEQTRARCLAQLARAGRPAPAPRTPAPPWRPLAPIVVVSGFCVLYFAALVTTALRFQDVLR
jgi:hypothetical protein